MVPIEGRIAFSPQDPYRTLRPSTDKIIFLSLEGSVTEEEYFKIVTDFYSNIKSKIQFISVVEDAVNTQHMFRTSEQNLILSKTRPLDLINRIDTFITANQKKYEFDKHSEDEFWIVTDVDKNWSLDQVSENKTYKDMWNEAVALCKEKGYNYAISNPFFELWLLLHHDDCNDNDSKYAVTEDREYVSTSHFIERLKSLGCSLIKKKHIDKKHYSKNKIIAATQRAKKLHVDTEDLEPHYLATTVYKLIEKIIEIAD